MYAETIDTGATIAKLRAFGPPQVVHLDDFAGNASAELGADRFWTVVRAVSFHVHDANLLALRFARLTWRAAEQTPFAQVMAAQALNTGDDVQVTFGLGLQPIANLQAGVVVSPMPELVLLPGWTLTADIVAGQPGDAITGVRCYLQRYQLIDLDDLLDG